jgi:NADPH:quinone reductase-like Zn-dependent oxidoreductase
LFEKPNRKGLEFLVTLVELGKIKPVTKKTYPLKQTAEAMRMRRIIRMHG